MPDSPDTTTLSPTAIAAPDLTRRSPPTDSNAPKRCVRGQASYVDAAPASDLDAPVNPGPGEAAINVAKPARHTGLKRHGEIPSGTQARDAYLDASAHAGAVGLALSGPRMRRALILVGLEQDHTRIANTLPEGYDATRKPPAWRSRERSEWQRHQHTARALNANAECQEQIRTELGPNSEQLARQALALTDTRDHILARTPELQRNAIQEELAREPKWLTDTLGARPEHGAGRWQTLAGQLAANRMRLLIADEADPGIRPEQAGLVQQVAQFQAEAGLTHTLGLKPDVGLGM